MTNSPNSDAPPPLRNSTTISSLPDVPREREKARIEVHVESPSVPMIDGETNPVRERWRARHQVFDLSDPNQVSASELVLQAIVDERAKPCEHRFFTDNAGVPKLYLRWIDLSYHV
jgi:hypothetical protein